MVAGWNFIAKANNDKRLHAMTTWKTLGYGPTE